MRRRDISQLKERIDAFADFNLPRPHFLSVGEYLDCLVETNVLNRDEAALVRAVYYRSRYAAEQVGEHCVRDASRADAKAFSAREQSQVAEVLRQLEQARVRLERYEESDRTQLGRRWQEQFEPPSSAESPSTDTTSPSAEKDVPRQDVGVEERPLSRSALSDSDKPETAFPSKERSRWRRMVASLAAPAFFLWTFAALGLAYWGHDHIDQTLQGYVSRWHYGVTPTERQQTLSRRRLFAAAAKGSQRVAAFERLALVYIEREQFAEAAVAYRLALAESPNDSELLNNLAWLLLTADDVYYCNPQQALPLAKRAHALRAAPHIKDTLAEAHYQLGHFATAVALERQALQMHPSRRSEYEQQLEKFLRAEEE